MLRQPPNRIQRSKGYRVKHAVQVFVVLAIVFWLINQLKHSYYNTKKFEAVTNGSKVSETVWNNSDEMITLGRKGLHPRVEDSVELKPEEVDDGINRGGGDDEIDSNDQEEAAEEADDLIDDVDDREREEVESDDNKLEGESSIDDQSEESSMIQKN